jgi:hypothetical protein
MVMRGLIWALLINVIFFLPENILAEADRAYVKLENGLLSVSLIDVQLKDVLEEISEQGKIKIIMEKDIEQSLTMEFNELPLEEGLKRLLEGTDYYMIFSPGKPTSPYLIKEVKIIPRSSEPRRTVQEVTPPPAPPVASTPPNPFVEALRAAQKKGKGTRKLTPEQKKAIIEAFGKGSEENRKKAEELLRKLEEGTQEEEKK